MKIIRLALLFVCGYLWAQTPQFITLLILKYDNITSTSFVIDNRSQFNAQTSNHTFYVTGTGTWSVTMQYSDSSNTGPWTNFSQSTATVNQGTSPGLGAAFGYHPYLRFNITGTVSVSYTGERNLYLPIGIGGGGSGVTSFNSRTGAVVPTTGDYLCSQITNCADTTGSYANPSWITSLAGSKITGNISGNAATATALAATPTQCDTGKAPQGIAANGNAQNCNPFLTPGGILNQFQINNGAGALTGVTISGDVNVNGSTGASTLANTAVTPGTYGDNSHVGQFTVDSKGRITAASSVAIAGGGGGASTISQLTDLQTVRTSATVLTVGSSCSSTTYCNVKIGEHVYAFATPGTATISADTGTAYVYVTSGGVLTVGYGGGTFMNGDVVCSGCTATFGVTAFPNESFPIAVWNATSGNWNTTGTDDRSAYSVQKTVTAGSNVTITETPTDITINASPTPGNVFSQTQSVTVSNTTMETTVTGTGVGSLTLPANFFTAGISVRVTAYGYYSVAATPTLDLKLKLGGSTILDSTAVTSNAGSNTGIVFTSVITCRTAGVTGTIFSQGSFTQLGNTGFQLTNTSTNTINTTGTLAVNLTATWGTASMSDTLTITNLIVELVGGGGSTGSGISGLTTNGIVTAASSTTIQTPNSSATMDSSGNISTPGTIQTTPGSTSGVSYFTGKTSGGSGFAVDDVAGTAILYLMPSTNGAANQALEDSGSATCPTLPSTTPSLPATCHQLVWVTPSGSGTVNSGTMGNIGYYATSTNAISDSGKAFQGTDTKVMTSGAISGGAGTGVCLDSNSGITTSGCTSGGLTLLEEHTASSSADLEFTTCIQSGYDTYEITLTNLLPASNAVDINWQVSTDGGSTWQAGTNYGWTRLGADLSAASVTTTTGDSRVQVGISVSNSTTWGGISGTYHIYNPAGSANKQFFGSGGYFLTIDSAWFIHNAIGFYQQSTAVNAFRMIASSGNLASGTVRCYGLSK